MVGVVLAGGKGTRLMPMTGLLNKHLLPVYDQPMLSYPLATLREAGVKKVCVVVGGHEPHEIRTWLGTGRTLGFDDVAFVEQAGEGGIADALRCARPVVGNQPMCVILGDNIFERSLASFAEVFRQTEATHAQVLLAHMVDPRAFGVPHFGSDGAITKITEKPTKPASQLAVVGAYFYPPTAWDAIDTLEPSTRGELEITDLNNWYAKQGLLRHGVIGGFWGDAGTPESLFQASARVREWRVRSGKTLD